MEYAVGEQGAGATLPSDTKIGEFCSSDIQVAINEGNRHRHAFFVVKMGKTGVAMPYQQMIPAYFSKYHPKLHLEDITLERPCGRSWGTTIRPLNNVCRFGKGWKQFSVENHLRERHQLLFHLVGKSRFVVHFFDHLGKSHDSFPPLTPCEKDEEDAKPQFETPVAIPLPQFETPVATPLESTPVAIPLPQFETPVATPLESTPVAIPLPQFETPVATPLESTPVAIPLPQFETPVATPLESTPVAIPLPQFETPVATPLESTPVAASLEATLVAAPLEFTPVSAPFEAPTVAKFPTEPKTPKPRTPGLNSDDAKVILRQFFTQVHPNMSTDVASSEDMAEGIGGTKQGSYEEEATAEGQAYIFIDSDDDDEPVKQESLIRTPIRRAFVQESYSGEQTGFHSLEKVRTPHRATKNMMLVEHAEQDDHYMRSKSYSDNQYLERQRPVRKKSSTRRASWESKADHDIPAAKPDGHGHRGTIRDLSEEKFSSRNGYRKDHGVSHSFSPAKALLTQQGCLNYSEIVSKRRWGYVTDEARQRILTAATRFAAGLKNENFLLAMEDLHVYHGFHLSIPRDFLEATGTLRANKVRACLMDNQRNCYETKWEWHAGCQTPFLNCDAWALFALDHVLEEGDVCVFELVGPGPAFLLSVHIFKCVMETSGRPDSSIRGGQSASRVNQKFGRHAADQEVMHDRSSKIRPIVDLGRPSVRKTIQKPYNLQAWTKLFKPRVKAQFGGRPGQSQS